MGGGGGEGNGVNGGPGPPGSHSYATGYGLICRKLISFFHFTKYKRETIFIFIWPYISLPQQGRDLLGIESKVGKYRSLE